MKSNCPTCGELSEGRSYHFRKHPDHKPEEWDACDQCGERYKSLSHHWGQNSNSCNYPDTHQDKIECANPKCDKSYRTYSSLQSHYEHNPGHKAREWPICPTCNEKFYHLSKHWGNTCSYPKFTGKQLDIVTGALMGDGNIQHEKSTPVFRINGFTEPEYLHYIDSIFGILGRGVTESETAKESYDNCGFEDKTKPGNYKDKYRWSTRSHPDLEEFSNWYASGEKIWPDDIEMTPTVLRHWFVTDGSTKGRQIRITASNEIGNEDKILGYFKYMDLPEPHFEYSERAKRGDKMDVVWSVNDSVELYEYMGRPVPGFEYKWMDYSTISEIR